MATGAWLRGHHLAPTQRAKQWPDALGLGLFAASGTVTNIGPVTERVPDVQVVLRDAQDRAVLLCADACWSHLTFRERRLPTWPARLVTHDWAAYVRTVERLHTLAHAAPDVAILPSHCQASLDAYRAATHGGSACASS